jgi:hypothetical protein
MSIKVILILFKINLTREFVIYLYCIKYKTEILIPIINVKTGYISF